MKVTKKVIGGRWERVAMVYVHECCKCHARDYVETRWTKNSYLFQRWTPIQKRVLVKTR